MTGNSVKIIHDAIGAAAKAVGFSKKGASWYAERGESVLLITPQKSQYGQQFFLRTCFKSLFNQAASASD